MQKITCRNIADMPYFCRSQSAGDALGPYGTKSRKKYYCASALTELQLNWFTSDIFLVSRSDLKHNGGDGYLIVKWQGKTWGTSNYNGSRLAVGDQDILNH